MSKRLSSKEEEILRKQRVLSHQREISRQSEASSQPSQPPPKVTLSSSSKNGKGTSLSSLLGQKKPSKVGKQNIKAIPKKVDSSKVIDLTKCDGVRPPPTKPPPPPPTKRPTMKRPTKRSSNSKGVSDEIAASRSRIQAINQKANSTNTQNTIASGGRLSSLLNQAGVTKSELKQTVKANKSTLDEEEDKNGSILDMDDYYRNLREWDFLKDWDKERGGGMDITSTNEHSDDGPQVSRKRRKEPPTSLLLNESATIENTPKTIPEIFQSRRQYQRYWAPLCLAETRAQFLSDASANLPWRENGSHNNRNSRKGDGTGPVLTNIKPFGKDVGANVDAMTVITSPQNNVMGPSFVSGDVVCLALTKEVFVKASKGQLVRSMWKNASSDSIKVFDSSLKGIIGHVEYSRRTLDGCKIRISRQQWIKFCKKEKVEQVYLLKLGGNVTSLREFTALSRVNTISMLPYVLCKKMTRAKDNLDHLSDILSNRSVMKPKKDDYIKKLGGKAALGEGFAKYARKKFNDSQLGAIAAACEEYGKGGFTLIKGPPGTGKTTTLVALLNALHIRQFNKYYTTVKTIVDVKNTQSATATKVALSQAQQQKPRLLVCAPSNNAIDNVIQKIMEGGFIDGSGGRYNPSIVRIGVGQSQVVKDVSLESRVKELMTEMEDPGRVQSAMAGYKSELTRLQTEIHSLRCRLVAILTACDYPLANEWEIRCEENCQVHYVNHLEKRTTYEKPPPPEPGEKFREAKSQPEYKVFMSRLVKLVDRFNSASSKLERYSLAKKSGESLRLNLETHILDTTHIVLTTLGTAGCMALEACSKFEVVVVDEAAQSVEPATLVALQLGSSHAILVGDPQQLPATIFNVSGRTTKFDRSLFQRLEEAGHEVHLLDTQYRMHPKISAFPRHIFYGGYLHDGSNVKDPTYGNPLMERLRIKLPKIQPLTLFDLDSSEERDGSSLCNSMEAILAVKIYQSLVRDFGIYVSTSKVSIITPYAQQASLLRRTFSQALGYDYSQSVEVNTVDSFQGREANIVIFSCVRASGSKGIGFLSDVRRMNVALTRAKHLLLVIARCESISVNPYWDQLITDAMDNKAVLKVPISFLESEGNLSQLSTKENGAMLKKQRM